jgi:hypothetical protein
MSKELATVVLDVADFGSYILPLLAILTVFIYDANHLTTDKTIPPELFFALTTK